MDPRPPPKLPICRPEPSDDDAEQALLRAMHVGQVALLDDLVCLVGDDRLVPGHTFESYREMLHEYFVNLRHQIDTCEAGHSCRAREGLERLAPERSRLKRYKVRLRRA